MGGHGLGDHASRRAGSARNSSPCEGGARGYPTRLVPHAAVNTEPTLSSDTAEGREELQSTEHVQVRLAGRCNDQVEQAHQPTRVREPVMRVCGVRPTAP